MKNNHEAQRRQAQFVASRNAASAGSVYDCFTCLYKLVCICCSLRSKFQGTKEKENSKQELPTHISNPHKLYKRFT